MNEEKQEQALTPPDEAPDLPVSDPEQDPAEALRRELEAAREQLTQLERERCLLSRGVPEEDLDYYVFKIGKLLGEGQDFDAAAQEFLKKQPAHRHGPALSTGASLAARVARPQGVNETMNRLLRGR